MAQRIGALQRCPVALAILESAALPGLRPRHGGDYASLMGSPVDRKMKCHCSPRPSSLYQSLRGCRVSSPFSLIGRLVPAIGRVAKNWIESAAFASS
jgi:hypothetical protein